MLLVTGITGHTGRHFLKVLARNGYSGKIRCIIRNPSHIAELLQSDLDIEPVIGDLNDKRFISSAMESIDVVLHIYNIHFSVSIVEAAIKNGVDRVILVHTTGIFSQFKYASDDYKRIENEIKELNYENKINVTILRPTMIYGDLCDHNISKFIKYTDKLSIIPVINYGENLIQPVNARDLAGAYYDVIMNREKTIGKEYNLSGHSPLSIRDLYKNIAKKLNKKVYLINIPIKLGIFIAKIIMIASFGKINYIEKVQRMTENRNFSHQDAVLDFNYKTISFDEGLEIEVNQYSKKNRSSPYVK